MVVDPVDVDVGQPARHLGLDVVVAVTEVGHGVLAREIAAEEVVERAEADQTSDRVVVLARR